MTKLVRVGGIAAAVVAFVATAAFAAPTPASQITPAPTAVSYTIHANATISGEEQTGNDLDAQVPAMPVTKAPAVVHAVATVGMNAAGFLNTAEIVPPSLGELVERYASSDTSSEEQDCLATAVYFEARGEPLEGQLAVAEVVLNRTRSGQYPTSICAVVKQPAQFSFVRHGRFPHVARGSESWRTAVGIAKIASADLIDEVAPDVLWYHADYVSPGWGHRLTRVTQIGAHIFYS